MSASVFDHPWLNGLFDAPDIAPLWQAEAQAAHLIAYERAWTEALFDADRITEGASREALRAIHNWKPDTKTLREGTARDGLVVPTLVAQLRKDLGDPKAIHSGSTSQDVLDTALVLTLRAVTNVLTHDLSALCAALDTRIGMDGEKRLVGRTRMQAALPIAVSHRLEQWRQPLSTLHGEADTLIKTLALQIGGAVGDGQALGDDAKQINAFVADRLGLPLPAASWHSDRGCLVRYSDWLTRIAGALGKIGQDITLMAQQGLDEITLKGGGGSSAMPHKQNPVLAELLVTLARFTAGQNGIMGQALIHEQERSGTAWALEWMVLPQMTMATGCATHSALKLLDSITGIGTPAR